MATKTSQQRSSHGNQEDERYRSSQQKSEHGQESHGGAMQRSQQGESRESERRQHRGLSRHEQGMSPVLSSPFSFLRRFGEGMESLFSDFGPGGMMHRGLGEMARWTPQIEMFQREGELVVRADLPGLNKEDVQVELSDDAIVVRGERRQERRQEREGIYATEVNYGSFYREIPLPDGVDAEHANAMFRDGVLEISMPCEEGRHRGRRLEIHEGEHERGRQGEQQAKHKAQAAGGGR